MLGKCSGKPEQRSCIFASLLDGPKGYTDEGVESPALPRHDDIITEICGAETFVKRMVLLTRAWIFNLFYAHSPMKTLLSYTALRLDCIGGENLLNKLIIPLVWKIMLKLIIKNLSSLHVLSHLRVYRYCRKHF